MAASTDEDTTDSETENFDLNLKLKCFPCIQAKEVLPINQFTEKTWSRCLNFVEKWKDLSGPQAAIAKDFVDRSSHGPNEVNATDSTVCPTHC